jgi:hypothetical protein
MAVGLQIVEGDIVFNESGCLEILNPAQKCSRDFSKMLITESENDNNTTSYYRYNPSYGTDLNNKLLYAGLSRVGVHDMMIFKLNASIKNYLVQQEQRRNLDLEEIITGVNFEVLFDSDDLRKLLVDIRYSTLNETNTSLGQFIQTIG